MWQFKAKFKTRIWGGEEKYVRKAVGEENMKEDDRKAV